MSVMATGAETTLLFVPATRCDRIAKAFSAGADAVIVDLEDAVDAARKEAARSELHAWLQGAVASSLPKVWIRVNAATTPWATADLELIHSHADAIAGVMQPKVETVDDLPLIPCRDGGTVPVLALIETARGILGVGEISRSGRAARLAFGSVDLARDLGCDDDPAVMQPYRSQLVLHSAACQLPAPVDGVTLAISDGERIEADARRALAQGFGAKLCIHPSQIAPCALGFMPTDEQTAWARQVLAAAQSDGSAIRANDQMIDRPVVERARSILARAGSTPRPT